MTTNKTDEIRNADGFIVSPDTGGGGYGGSGYVDTTPGAVSGDRAEIDSLRAENERLRSAQKVQAAAMRTANRSEAIELNRLRSMMYEAQLATNALASEREANALLTDEIERLRSEIDTIHRADATEINSLRAEIERLRAALEPFALVVPFDFAADNEPVLMPIKASAFRQARAALEAKE